MPTVEASAPTDALIWSAVPNGAPQKSVAPMSANCRTLAFTSASVPTMATSAGPPAPSRSSMAR